MPKKQATAKRTRKAPEGPSFAAELRAVADWLERKWPQGLDMHPCACAAWLRAEAKQAEAGQ